jgi:SAM-dependent methyltransferase
MTEQETRSPSESVPVSLHPAHVDSWSTYLQAFHATRPGITEDVLATATATATDGRVDPYSWLVEGLPRRGRVLDLACGSGPMTRLIGADRWVGFDRSPEELARAAAGVGRLVRGDAKRLPFPNASFSAVVCSMALMILQPVEQVLLEVRRMLDHGGTAVFMVPGSRPLTLHDLYRYGRLMVAVRQTHLAYPNDRLLRRLDTLLDTSDLVRISDERIRFTCRLEDIEASSAICRLALPAGRRQRPGSPSRPGFRAMGGEWTRRTSAANHRSRKVKPLPLVPEHDPRVALWLGPAIPTGCLRTRPACAGQGPDRPGRSTRWP